VMGKEASPPVIPASNFQKFPTLLPSLTAVCLSFFELEPIPLYSMSYFLFFKRFASYTHLHSNVYTMCLLCVGYSPYTQGKIET
jgi:hypothetical protein